MIYRITLIFTVVKGKDTQLSLEFKMISEEKVNADFTGEEVIPNAGVTVL